MWRRASNSRLSGITSALRFRQRWPEAIADFTAALDRDPKDAESWDGRGRAFASRKEWDRFIADMRRACALRPAPSWLWYQLGMAYMGKGDTKAYRQVCRRMLEKCRDSNDFEGVHAITYLAAIYPDAVPDDQAHVGLAERLYRSNPKGAFYAKALGAALLWAGRYVEAVRHLQEAVALHGGGSERMHLFLALTHQRLHQQTAGTQAVGLLAAPGCGPLHALSTLGAASQPARQSLARALRLSKQPDAVGWLYEVQRRVLLPEVEAALGVQAAAGRNPR
jgi:tetratricopeptide (TPR) repeat protein